MMIDPAPKKPKVKVCGITNLEDARFCAGAGADFLGFILYPESPRFIRPGLARQIIEWLHGSLTVGVFVNEPAESVNAIAEAVGFDLIQASGAESPEWCALIDRPVIKAIHVMPGDSVDDLRRRSAPYENHVDHFLYDTGKTGSWGGTGETFNWQILQPKFWKDHAMFLAGGLNPDNVLKAISLTEPYAIDLSSGLEDRPGHKDYEQVELLFDRIRKLG